MRALIQRVETAKVVVDDAVVGQIEVGLLVLLAIHKNDSPQKTLKMVQKVANLRIFRDGQDKMNLSIKDVNGSLLVVSQFTLYGNCLNGRRPDFISTAPPAIAEPIYEKFVQEMRLEGLRVETGRFGAAMKVHLVNDGPVTFLIEL